MNFYLAKDRWWSPVKKLKDAFFIVLFCEEKYQKSARRTRAVLLPNYQRRARVSRTSHAWRVRAARGKAQVGGFAALHSFIHTTRANKVHEEAEQIRARKPARPLKVQGGRDSSTCADGTIKINPISPCSHTDAHPNLNREVRHSPTWHSSESESALERFEPVAAAMLWSDGQGTLFALVAARRQKVFKRGIDTYAKHVCRRRRDGSQRVPLFVLFVLFGQAKRTLKEKYHKETFLYRTFL